VSSGSRGPAPTAITDLDPLATGDDPYAVYARLSAQGPVLFHPQRECWFATRYEEAERVLRDHTCFTSTQGPGVRRVVNARRGAAFLTDPPEHKRLRSIVLASFTAASMRAWEARAATLADAYVRELVASSSPDFVRDVAARLPFAIACEIAGLEIGNSAAARLVASGPAGDVQPGEVRAGYDALHDLIRPALRGSAPAGGVLALLVDAMDAGIADEDEAVDVIALVLAAASHTTVFLITNVVAALLDRPELRRELWRRPELAHDVVEETLRWDPPVQAVFRTATCAVDLGGQRIEAGQRAAALVGAANRDPSRFADPERFVPGRDGPRTLVFSSGVHVCPGSAVARFEARAVLHALTRHTTDVEAGGVHATRVSGFMRGYSSLPLHVTPTVTRRRRSSR
jgi:cytochrome P450